MPDGARAGEVAVRSPLNASVDELYQAAINVRTSVSRSVGEVTRCPTPDRI